MKWWAEIALFILAFLTFFKTLCPTIYVGDSGELITAASGLGIPHPPGYPIFVLLIRLASLLFPFGSFALRCGLVSAISGAVAVLLLYRISVLILSFGEGERRATRFAIPSSAAAAIIFTFSLTLWSQTTIAEVYALTLMIILLLFYLVLIWERGEEGQRDHRYLILAAFIGGLGLSSHHTVALILTALTAYIIYRSPRTILNWGLVSSAILFGILGVSVHIYLAIRASCDPALNWGVPDTLSSFISHILRREYGSPSHTERSLALLFSQLGFYLGTLVRQFTPLGFGLSIIGLVAAIKRRNRALLLLAVTFLLCSLFFILYTNFRLIPRDKYLVEVFFIPSFAIAAIFIAFALQFLFEKAHFLIKAENGRVIAFGALCSIACALPLLANYHPSDKSRHYLTYDYGISILESVPRDDSVVLVDRDMEVFTILFLQDVERICPDIEMIDRSGILRRDFYPEGMRLMPEQSRTVAQLKAEHAFIRKERRRPICYVPGVDLGDISDEYKLMPVGVATLLKPTESAGQYTDEERNVPSLFRERSLHDRSLFNDYTSRCVAMVWLFQLGDSLYWQGDRDAGIELWRESSKTADDIMILHTMLAEKAASMGLLDLAIDEYSKIGELRPDDHLVPMNLGMLYEQQGKPSEAIREFKRAYTIKPDFLPAMKAAIEISLRQKDYAQAIESATKLGSLMPLDPEVQRNIGVVFDRAGKYREALNAYERAASLRPTFALVHADIGLLKERMGDMEGARESLQRALALDPALAHTDRRFQASELAKELSGKINASQSAELESLSSDELKARIQALIASRQIGPAIEAYRRLAQLEPKDAQIRVSMGVLLDQVGNPDEAQKAFEEATKIDPNSAEAHNALGVAYAKKEDYANARKHWEMALAIKPDSESTLSNLKQLEQLGY
ncbi:MAG: DUF2723 domain-containing protein [Candidatus Coatesbacteria bacterium]|nr:DUF2723 domain-containing protein [Candidatus Coatesbacteria bacterium]